MKAISKATGVPYFTVLSWRREPPKKAPEFRELTVRETPGSETRISTATVATRLEVVTVTTAKGLRIEGITFEEVERLLERRLV